MSVAEAAGEPVMSAGTPCWIELAATDEASAARFYTELFGWNFTFRPDPATPSGQYAIASRSGISTAGLYQVGAGRPPGWIPHLAVPNTVTAAEWVAHLGGRNTVGPVDLPGRGSILHSLDPTGAPVVFWRPTDSWEFASGATWTFAGADLNTHDGRAADQFYCRLFNFTSQQIGDYQTIDYAEWRLEHRSMLYRYVMGPEYRPDTPPHWMVYFAVDPARGADGVAGHALMLGGTVLTQPFDTPFGRTAILADPGGAVFSIIDHSRAIEGTGQAEVDDPYVD
ncbi:glyoxalase [Amycolatopsis antarctica]|uniref:Glyoxalase n=1 Tax=Amycolatopsis antarctica TaxID=1854586 RepID=A0A263D812_9PSEU|nr:VOC family protein [Amycolatopsis antarctica]OZM74138.1 glyoxalase [Amycolatopsis antarctica]